MTNIDEALLAEQLLRLRDESGLSQEDLAAKSDVSRSTIQKIERQTWLAGKPLSATRMKRLRRLAAGLEVEATDLLKTRDQQDAENQEAARADLREKLGRDPSEDEIRGWLLRGAFRSAVRREREHRGETGNST